MDRSVDDLALTKAVTRVAHAQRRVEREALRRQLRKRNATARARLAERRLLPAVGALDNEAAFALAEAELHSLREARALGRPHDESIDDELHAVLLPFVDRRQCVEEMNPPVEPHPHEAAPA
jgi:hypothetical protein